MDINLIFLVSSGFVGGYLGKVSRIPGGVLLGAMLLTVLCNLFISHLDSLPVGYAFLLQVLAGGLVGQEINNRMLKNIRFVILPVGISVGITLGIAVILMFAANMLFHWDLTTAWLAICPGRMQDMIVIAGSLGLDGSKIISVQLARTLVIILFTTSFLSINSKKNKKNDSHTSIEDKTTPGEDIEEDTENDKIYNEKIELAKLLASAFAGGIIGMMLNVPGGILLGAVIVVGIIKMNGWGQGKFPAGATFILLVLAGILLGIKFKLEELSLLTDILLPSFFIAIVFVLTGLISALIISKITGWDRTIAWLAVSPGRMQEMVIMAHSLQLDSSKVIATHTTRVVTVVIVTPVIISIID